jgi:hypothetical protein
MPKNYIENYVAFSTERKTRHYFSFIFVYRRLFPFFNCFNIIKSYISSHIFRMSKNYIENYVAFSIERKTRHYFPLSSFIGVYFRSLTVLTLLRVTFHHVFSECPKITSKITWHFQQRRKRGIISPLSSFIRVYFCSLTVLTWTHSNCHLQLSASR